MINAREFSSSVSAISFGLLGEPTSIPALRERDLILKEGKQLTALRNTMFGSLFGMFLGLIVLIGAICTSANFPVLMRTDVIAFFILITFGFLIFWRVNNWLVNLTLIVVGYTAGMVGYSWILNKEFLTFGSAYLSGGIPIMPLLLGIYAVPKMLEIMQITTPKHYELKKVSKFDKLHFPTLARGGIIGTVCGLIPFVGTGISSVLSHLVEGKFFKKQNGNNALLRLVSAETANNASQVTVLIPLIILGLALQPSELILIDILEGSGWAQLMFTDPDGMFAIPWTFLLSIAIILPIGCLITAFFCYNFVKRLLSFFADHIKIIISSLLIILVFDIIYFGWAVDQTIYYLIVFIISLIIGVTIGKKIEMVPFIMSFLLHEHFADVLNRLPLLYN